MLKTVQQTLSCATEMLFVRLWRGPAAASAFPDTLEMEKYALVITTGADPAFLLGEGVHSSLALLQHQ